MSQLTFEQYDRLERAVARGERVAMYRRGAEYVVIPLALASHGGREVVHTRNPTTGDHISLFLDEIETVETVGQ